MNLRGRTQDGRRYRSASASCATDKVAGTPPRSTSRQVWDRHDRPLIPQPRRLNTMGGIVLRIEQAAKSAGVDERVPTIGIGLVRVPKLLQGGPP